MICSKCQCDFCCNCGKRRLGWKFVGSHESRYSPLGCKYNLYPKKPILRHKVRELVTGVAPLAVPVAVVGAVVVLALGTTIAASTYGMYRLVKHVQSERYERQRRREMETISRQWTTSDSLSIYVHGSDEQVEIEKAIQASLMTFREEIHQREQRQMTPYSIRHRHSNFRKDDEDDDVDDSLNGWSLPIVRFFVKRKEYSLSVLPLVSLSAIFYSHDVQM